MTYLPEKRKNKKLVLYNFNYKKEIKNMYKAMVWPHLKWIAPAILATVVGFWVQWEVMTIAGIIALMYRIYRYLNVFSLVTKKIQFLDKKVIDDNIISEGEKIIFDDLKFISTPLMEIVYFTKKGLIVIDGFMVWDDNENRQEFLKLFKNYRQELNLTLQKVA